MAFVCRRSTPNGRSKKSSVNVRKGQTAGCDKKASRISLGGKGQFAGEKQRRQRQRQTETETDRVMQVASRIDGKENIMPCCTSRSTTGDTSTLLFDGGADTERKKKQKKKMKKKKFYGCYLLVSQGVRAKGRTYIGFTVKPKRRIRQHNGELAMGACRTRMGRPWEMVLVVYGFSSQARALAFEWAWQHPKRSKSIRDEIAKMKSGQLSGVKGKARILRQLLLSEVFENERLKVQILDSKYADPVCPLLGHISRNGGSLPVSIAPLESLPDSNEPLDEDCEDDEEGEEEVSEEEEEERRQGCNVTSSKCMLCFEDLIEGCASLSCRCESRFHPSCLENHFAKRESCDISQHQVDQGPCPLCGYELTWDEALALGREREREAEALGEEERVEKEGKQLPPVNSSSLPEELSDEEETILPLEQRLKERKRVRDRMPKTKPKTKKSNSKDSVPRAKPNAATDAEITSSPGRSGVLTPKKKKAPPAKAPPVEIINLISPTK